MQINNILEHVTCTPDGPVKTPILKEENFALIRIALGKGVTIPPHQGGHAVFFLVIQGKGIFTHGDKETELGPHDYIHIRADETRGIQALDDLVVLVVKS